MRAEEEKVRQKELEAIEKFYQDKFELLAEDMEKQKKKISENQRESKKRLRSVKSELNRRLENEIKDMQVQKLKFERYFNRSLKFGTTSKTISGRYCKRKRINVFSRFRARTSHESNSSRKIYAENESSFQNITNLPPFSLFLYFCSRYFFIFMENIYLIFVELLTCRMTNTLGKRRV